MIVVNQSHINENDVVNRLQNQYGILLNKRQAEKEH